MQSPTVLISGVSTGIGRAGAEKLLSEGWRVYGSVRKAGDAQELSTAYPERFHELVFDVTDPTARQAGVATIKQNGHTLRALINNAGIAVSGPLENISEEDVRRQFEVNVFGLLGLTQDCLPLLHESKAAGIEKVRIINVSSVSGIFASAFTALYSASKFAVEALTDGLRRELMPFDIDVISVAPGPVKTPIWQKAADRAHVFENSRYAFILDRLPAYLENTEKSAIPAALIAHRFYEVLTTDRPRPFNLLMSKAWLMKIVRHLPKRMQDKMVWKNLNSSKRY